MIGLNWVVLVVVFGWVISSKAEAKFISVADTPFDCITEALYFEARNQSSIGQIAVANAILNRTRHSSHPDTVCGVVHEVNKSGVAQFSYYADGKKEVVDDLTAWRKARNLAAYVMYDQVFDPTEGSTMYHADYVSPNWDWTKLTKVVRIDTHIFYSEK
jgi:spore germination cell wall hydrolase CwlJ-like protein